MAASPCFRAHIQFRQLIVKICSPLQFVAKLMADPELATAITNPNVMSAIAECTQNPMAIFKYQVSARVFGTYPSACVRQSNLRGQVFVHELASATSR